MVAGGSEVAEGPLGSARFLLDERELVRELDEELAVALALVLRQRQDASHVVVVRRLLGAWAEADRGRQREMDARAHVCVCVGGWMDVCVYVCVRAFCLEK